jgi:hypothetical protein
MTEGARYEVSFDGTVRTHRDARESAIEVANALKAGSPYGKVIIRDLLTGETTSDSRVVISKLELVYIFRARG